MQRGFTGNFTGRSLSGNVLTFRAFAESGDYATVWPVLIYAVTIFLGAFLLFQVQPLIGKYILPWFGGGPGVWSACMLFFQAALLAGYAYAHATTRWLRPRTQAVIHLALLAAAIALLPITPSNAWRPHGVENPTSSILLLLLASVGLPYFVLSTTGPLLQHWFSVTRGGASPYRLYALSNVGSLLALLSYPVWFEANLSRKTQAALWGWCLVAYALACALCAWGFWKTNAHPTNPQVRSSQPDSTPDASPLLDKCLWLLFPACASILLLATTNKLCLDVASVPFLWIVPLSLYLLTFIICFDSPRWYRRQPYLLLLIGGMIGICLALFDGPDWPVWRQVAVYCGGLFLCCMVCHGELYRLRPAPRHLTAFYLTIAAGGALGGLFVAVLAPWIFPGFYELHLGLILCAVLVLSVSLKARQSTRGESPAKVTSSSMPTLQPALAGSHETGEAALSQPSIGYEEITTGDGGSPPNNPFGPEPTAEPAEQRDNRSWRWMACLLTVGVFAGGHWLIDDLPWSNRYLSWIRIGWWGLLGALIAWLTLRSWRTFRYWRALACSCLALGLAALGWTLWDNVREDAEDAVYRSRNFYGVLTVNEYYADDPLSHYRLLQHGRITHGLQFVDPAQARWPTSYYSESSGIGLALQAIQTRNRRLAVVGLGTGSLAVYAEEGDTLRIYEINPEVKQVATSHFSYLRDCRAKVEIVSGDARLSMEREPAQEYDLLALDAFSSDSIPVHLLTRESFQLYDRHLKTNGVIAVHISNHYLDLEPVVRAAANDLQFQVATVDYEETDEEWWLYSSTWMLLSRNHALLNRPDIAALTIAPPTNTVSPTLWTDDYASVFKILR